jgi:hypothetical protein
MMDNQKRSHLTVMEMFIKLKQNKKSVKTNV